MQSFIIDRWSTRAQGLPEIQRIFRVHHDVEDRDHVLVRSEVPEQLQFTQDAFGISQVSEDVLHLFDRHSLARRLQHQRAGNSMSGTFVTSTTFFLHFLQSA